MRGNKMLLPSLTDDSLQEQYTLWLFCFDFISQNSSQGFLKLHVFASEPPISSA